MPHAIGRRDLHIRFARPDQLHEIGKAWLLEPQGRLGPAEMVEDHRHGGSSNQILQAAMMARFVFRLHVPLAALHALDSRLEALARHGGP